MRLSAIRKLVAGDPSTMYTHIHVGPYIQENLQVEHPLCRPLDISANVYVNTLVYDLNDSQESSLKLVYENSASRYDPIVYTSPSRAYSAHTPIGGRLLTLCRLLSLRACARSRVRRKMSVIECNQLTAFDGVQLQQGNGDRQHEHQ